MKTIATLLFLTLFICACGHNPNNDCCEKVNNERPSQAISYQEVASMFKEYDNGQRKVLNEYITTRSRGKESVATISQFYSLSELKQYIAYIEKLSEEKEIELTGVRIFTSAYPSDYEKEEYRNKVAFILFPTTNIDGKENIAYEPLQSGIKKPVSMMSVLNKFADKTTKEVNRASILDVNYQIPTPSSGLNKGSLSPPN